MALVEVSIPYRFIRSRVRMSWREARFGLERRLLDPKGVIEFAMEQVAELDHPSPALLDLAGARTHEAVLGLVDQLADGEHPRPEKEIWDKWLYLVLAWIYEHRDEYPDPLQVVEEIYVDFAHPKQLLKFLRYMPMDGPDLGSREANERRLFERWKRYLDETAAAYAPNKGFSGR